MIEITKYLSIPNDEISFKFSRSGKPGGQNVNKVNTRVTLQFNVRNSLSLSPQQRALILIKLKHRINNQGILIIHSQKFRNQAANKEDAIERFKKLLSRALRTDKTRKKTRIPLSAVQIRLETKRRRSRLKQMRSGKFTGEE